MHQINKEHLKMLFRVETFKALAEVIDTMPPSLVMYHLEALLSTSSDSHSFSVSQARSEIRNSEYIIYIDYENEIYLDLFKSDDDTSSFWE